MRPEQGKIYWLRVTGIKLRCSKCIKVIEGGGIFRAHGIDGYWIERDDEIISEYEPPERRWWQFWRRS